MSVTLTARKVMAYIVSGTSILINTSRGLGRGVRQGGLATLYKTLGNCSLSSPVLKRLFLKYRSYYISYSCDFSSRSWLDTYFFWHYFPPKYTDMNISPLSQKSVYNTHKYSQAHWLKIFFPWVSMAVNVDCSDDFKQSMLIEHNPAKYFQSFYIVSACISEWIVTPKSYCALTVTQHVRHYHYS